MFTLHYDLQLHAATWCKALLDSGMDVSATDKSGSTPRREAAKRGNADLVEMFCMHGGESAAIEYGLASESSMLG